MQAVHLSVTEAALQSQGKTVIYMIMLDLLLHNCPLDLPLHILLLDPFVEHVVHVGLCMVDTLPADGSHVVGLQEAFGSWHTPIFLKDVKQD